MGGMNNLSGGVIGGAGHSSSVDMMYMGSKPKGSNMQGKWKDAVTTAKAAANNDEWKTVVVKATRHNPGPPKKKHVARIMAGLGFGGSISNRESPVGGIFYHMRKRLMQNDWIVVLKALTIFHHVFREGNEKFTAYVAASARDIFVMDSFSDPTGQGRAHMGFIKSYGAYLEQWCAMRAAIDFPRSSRGDGAGTAKYRTAPVEELYAGLPVMMDTVEKVFALELGGHIRYAPAAQPGITMVLRDLTILWVALTEGMIRLLDLFFELPQDKAPIGLDIYKRYVGIVEVARTFFNMANQLGAWNAPETTVVSTDLIESMEDYVQNGPQKDRIEPDFSSEEEYEPEPEPEPYYEPEPEYYSEEELPPPPPPPPPPRPRTPTPEPEPSSSSESEEEESSSEEEPEPEEPPPPPPKPAPPKPFDPLADLLGIEGEANGSANGVANGQVAVYNPATANMYQRAVFENTMEDRVNNVKSLMAAGGRATQNPNRGQVGMMGMHNAHNMQLALVNQQQANAYATNMYQTQQQQLMAYQTVAAMQYQTQYNNQMAMMQMQQQQRGGHAGMMGQYVPAPRGDNIVPAMSAEKTAIAPQNYRVKRGTKPTRVNADDSAFGPLLDQMKNVSLGGK